MVKNPKRVTPASRPHRPVLTWVALTLSITSLGLSAWALISVRTSVAAGDSLVLRFTGYSEEGAAFKIEPVNPAQSLTKMQVHWAGGETFNVITQFDAETSISSHAREYATTLKPGCLESVYDTFHYAFGVTTEYVSGGERKYDLSIYTADVRMYGPNYGSTVHVPAIAFAERYKTEEQLREGLARANKQALAVHNATLKCPEYQQGPNGPVLVQPVEPPS